MNATSQIQGRKWRRCVAVIGVWLTAFALNAADTNTSPPEALEPISPADLFEGGTNDYNNWIDLGVGGYFENGNKAQFQQQQQTPGGAFGGINDFHYQKNLNDSTTMSVDGRALPANNDYKLKLDLERDKLGYLKFSFDQFRTWENGDGGFYPPTGAFYPLSSDALALDRGRINFEAGLNLENKPKIVFKYAHDYRNGEDGSTIWGGTHPEAGVSQALSPSFYSINEHSDTFSLDVTHTIKSTDMGAGVSYESGKLDDALKINQYPGESVAQKITDQQGSSYDLLNVHAFSETWFKKNLMFSSGFSYSDLDENFSGNRIYGSDFDVGYVPGALSGSGYTSLSGNAHLHEYVIDMNLFYQLRKHLTIVPSVRLQKENSDANSQANETLGLFTPVPFSSSGGEDDLDIRERLDVNYTGLTNWVLYARGDWTEGTGNFNMNGGLPPIGGIGTAPVQNLTDDTRFFQKYSAGARWYPRPAVNLDMGGYYKNNSYNYNFITDSTPNNGDPAYPAFLVMQDFQTCDGNVRLTLRPVRTVTLVSRYEYQYSTIQTEPDPVSGLSSEQSSTMTSQIIAQDVAWIPWSRLSLQASLSYVLSETKTPASEVTQAILNSENNYWTVNFSSSFVLDDKTDLNLAYFYYRANDYQDNAPEGVPYGAGGQEQGITATLVRRITKNLRILLKYGYFEYHDQLYGGNDNTSGQLVYTSLQYRF